MVQCLVHAFLTEKERQFSFEDGTIVFLLGILMSLMLGFTKVNCSLQNTSGKKNLDFYIKEKSTEKQKKTTDTGCSKHTCELRNSLTMKCYQQCKYIADCNSLWIHQNS